MYIKGKNRGGPKPLPAHPKKHHKPYRTRHLGLFVSGCLVLILSAFGAGYLVGQSDVSDVIAPAPSANPSPEPSPSEVKSSLGFSFMYDPAVFSASGQTETGKTVTGTGLKRNEALSEVHLRPKSSELNGQEVLSELDVNVADPSSFASFKRAGGYVTDAEALANYFAPHDDQNFSVEKVSEESIVLGRATFQKVVYKQKPLFTHDAEPVYSVMISGMVKNRPMQIYLKNLFGNGQTPSIYGQVFASLKVGDSKPGVLSDTSGTQSFDINKVSPAVVKIYHLVCGRLVINNVKYGHDACDGDTGSGFFVSGDGYVATSGHVVVMDAADILVNQLLSDPKLLSQFTAAAGLTSEQSTQTDVVASVLARLYDLPSEKLRLENRREITFAALGNQPLPISNQDQANKAFSLKDTDYLKQAKIINVSYHPKDLLVIEQNTQTGFSASDVALLKVSATNTPFIRMADSSIMTQNSPVSLIGFPADADNQLTDNDTITPTVTNGALSSIRMANGSSSLLFQTDADASAGSSGGPAINQSGQAFGIVTYRFKSGDETNAAKSYIRDIADFAALADAKNISLYVKSPTQDHWNAGLDLFQSQRYSKALIEFRQVQKLYPAHRLVGNYIIQAQQAIRDGKDKKDPPYGVLAAIFAGLCGIAASIFAANLIIRHRRAHLAYKASYDAQGIVRPAQ